MLRQLFYSKDDAVKYFGNVLNGNQINIQDTPNDRLNVFVVSDKSYENEVGRMTGGRQSQVDVASARAAVSRLRLAASSYTRLSSAWSSLSPQERAEQFRVAGSIRSWDSDKPTHFGALKIAAASKIFFDKHPGLRAGGFSDRVVHLPVLAPHVEECKSFKTFEDAISHQKSVKLGGVRLLSRSLGMNAEQVGKFVLMTRENKGKLLQRYLSGALSRVRADADRLSSFNASIQKLKLTDKKDYQVFFRCISGATGPGDVGPAIARAMDTIRSQARMVSSALRGAGHGVSNSGPPSPPSGIHPLQRPGELLVRSCLQPQSVERLVQVGTPPVPGLLVRCVRRLCWGGNRVIERQPSGMFRLMQGGKTSTLEFLRAIPKADRLEIVLQTSSMDPLVVPVSEISSCDMYDTVLQPGSGYRLSSKFETLHICLNPKHLIVSRFPTAQAGKPAGHYWHSIQSRAVGGTIWCGGSGDSVPMESLGLPVVHDDDYSLHQPHQWTPKTPFMPLPSLDKQTVGGASQFRIIQTLKKPADGKDIPLIYRNNSLRSYFPQHFVPFVSPNLLYPLFLTTDFE